MSSTVVGEKPIYPVGRRWTRHKLDVPIRVILRNEKHSRVITGRGREISEGGMAVFVGVELRQGTKSKWSLPRPMADPFVCRESSGTATATATAWNFLP